MLVKKMNETKQETSDEGKQNYWFRDLEESLEIKKINLYYLSWNQPERSDKKIKFITNIMNYNVAK